MTPAIAKLRPRAIRAAAARLWRAWRRERALATTLGTLDPLSDAMLHDVGLHRGDLRGGVLRRSVER
jgi:uncharacterized protein YjiS (DUF1127 family)